MCKIFFLLAILSFLGVAFSSIFGLNLYGVVENSPEFMNALVENAKSLNIPNPEGLRKMFQSSVPLELGCNQSIELHKPSHGSHTFLIEPARRGDWYVRVEVGPSELKGIVYNDGTTAKFSYPIEKS